MRLAGERVRACSIDGVVVQIPEMKGVLIARKCQILGQSVQEFQSPVMPDSRGISKCRGT